MKGQFRAIVLYHSSQRYNKALVPQILAIQYKFSNAAAALNIHSKVKVILIYLKQYNEKYFR